MQDNPGRRKQFQCLRRGTRTGSDGTEPGATCAGPGQGRQFRIVAGRDPGQRRDFFEDFFVAAFRAVFFAAVFFAAFFLPPPFFAAGFLAAFLAFLVLAALTPPADFFAFFTAFAAAFTGADFAAAFLMRPTTAFAAVLASMVAPLTTRSPTASARFGWPVVAGVFSVSMASSRLREKPSRFGRRDRTATIVPRAGKAR